MRPRILLWMKRLIRWSLIGFGVYTIPSFIVLMATHNPQNIDDLIFGSLFPVSLGFPLSFLLGLLGGIIGWALFKNNSKEILGSVIGGLLSCGLGWIIFTVVFKSGNRELISIFTGFLSPIGFVWMFIVVNVYELYEMLLNLIYR